MKREFGEKRKNFFDFFQFRLFEFFLCFSSDFFRKNFERKSRKEKKRKIKFVLYITFFVFYFHNVWESTDKKHFEHLMLCITVSSGENVIAVFG